MSRRYDRDYDGYERGYTETSERGRYGRDYDYGSTPRSDYGRYDRNRDEEEYGYSGRGYERSFDAGTSGGGYYGGHANRGYGHDRSYPNNRYNRGEREYYGDERPWYDRAADEVASWFGNEDAERRRRLDELRERSYRGRGPKGYRRSDDRIKEDVSDRLTDDPYLDASDIEVSVKDCEVTLTGTVETRFGKRLAELLAEMVFGVTNVENRLRVNRNFTPSTTTSETMSTESRSAGRAAKATA